MSRRVVGCCGGLPRRVVSLLRTSARGRRADVPGEEPVGRGLVLRGRIWPGGDAPVLTDGTVIVDGLGRVATIGPADQVDAPPNLPVITGVWIGPGIVDTHVHLAFGEPAAELHGGVVAVRDLGAPPERARAWQTGGQGRAGSPAVSVAGPLLTAPGGYPSTSWGADGFAAFLADAADARHQVRRLVADGVDLVKLALEPAAGPVPSPAVASAVVRTAHECGVGVTAHALTAAMVERALDAGVDELCHVPVEPLSVALVERVSSAGIPVVSTLQTFFTSGQGASAAANAAELVRAGVPLVYGTDLGNAGTRPGVDPRELGRLADAGLGALGALRAATDVAATVAGTPGGVTGILRAGAAAHLVVLDADPLTDPTAWQRPRVVVTAGRVVRPAA